MSPHPISAGVLYAAAFVIAAIVSLLATPLVVRLAIHLGIVDNDGARAAHARPAEAARRRHRCLLRLCVCALRGAGRIARFAVSAACPSTEQFDAIHRLVGLLFGSLLIFGVGIWDDVMHMRARNKLVAQIVVALISMLYGFVIPGINNPFDHNPGTNWIDFPLWVGVPLTLLWYVGMMNAINFLDGLDGLLAGVAAISSVFLFVIAVAARQPGRGLGRDRAGRRGAGLSAV